MLKIAIVEDEKQASDALVSFLHTYGEKSGEQFDVSVFATSGAFIANYNTDYDIVFMDIELPDGNGMDTAKALRRLDGGVTLIFVTNMAQYAIKGYSVSALDFMVKPVSYYSFSTMLSRAIVRCRAEKKADWIIHTVGGAAKVELKSISYVEVRDHKLVYHTDDGDFEEWGRLGDLEKQLSAKGFARGNNCYLINLRKVVAIEESRVRLNGCVLQLSRARKKEFVRAFAEFISGTGGEG